MGRQTRNRNRSPRKQNYFFSMISVPSVVSLFWRIVCFLRVSDFPQATG